jgi:glycosyltransferase involved in cell wall biosynthesis
MTNLPFHGVVPLDGRRQFTYSIQRQKWQDFREVGHAQFGRLALELSKRYGWKCSFIIKDLSSCPTPTREMLDRLELHRLALSPELRTQQLTPWPQIYGRYLHLCEAVFEAVRARPQLRPDLVVAHDGLGPGLFLPELLDCPMVNYCEYYFTPSRRDLTYRIDLPPAEPAPFYPRCINAATLINLAAYEAAYAPTEWQRRSFPERFRHKIEVHFDGIDTDLYRPRRVPRVLAGRSISPETRVITFVARGLESMRGFDLFMRVAQGIGRARRDVLFVVVGQEESYYSWDLLHTGQPSFKQWALSQGDYDLSRFVFIHHLEPEQLSELLCLSDLHLYLTVPFVLSWSLMDALACGCVVLASDVPPVREVIEPNRTGLIHVLFDTEGQVETALRVLDDPVAFAPLGRAARALMEEKYSLDVAVPELKDYFERCCS